MSFDFDVNFLIKLLDCKIDFILPKEHQMEAIPDLQIWGVHINLIILIAIASILIITTFDPMLVLNVLLILTSVESVLDIRVSFLIDRFVNMLILVHPV